MQISPEEGRFPINLPGLKIGFGLPEEFVIGLVDAMNEKTIRPLARRQKAPRGLGRRTTARVEYSLRRRAFS